MQTITMGANELKKLRRETFIAVLTERKDLIEDAIVEVIEDIGLGIAMAEERTDEYVDNQKFIKN